MTSRRVLYALVSLVLASWFAGGSHRGALVPPVHTNAARKAAAVRLASGAQSDQYSTTILNDSPSAYYRLDDPGTTAADSSGNGLNGTTGANVTTGAPGLLTPVQDTAMTFPGTASAAGTVVVPATPLLQPASAVSLEAWIKFTATPATYAVAVAYGSDSFYAPYDLFFRAGRTLVAQFYLSSGVVEVVDPTPLSVNTVYHAVSTYDGTTARLYVNGAQVASVAKSGTIANYQPAYGLVIGDDAGFSDPAFAGTVDEVAVYANKTLTAAQALAHYQAGTSVQNVTPTPSPTASPTPSPSPSPSPSSSPSGTYAATVLSDAPGAYYRLDDTGTVAADASGHGFNGATGSGVTLGAAGLIVTAADNAMGFPGTRSASGTVLVPASSALQPATNLSLEAWLRFSTMPATYTVAVAYGSDSFYAPYALFFRSGGQLVAQFYLNSGVLEVPDPAPLRANTIYHAVSTYDGTTGRLYVNGTQVASVAKSGTIANYLPNYGLAIGDDAAFSDPAFAGTIDEVAVYPGKTLSATQVQAHYTAGTNPNATPPPTPTPSPTPAGAFDWPTMGYDNQRTGYNPNETVLGTGSFGTLHQLWSASVGGEVGEPAFAANVNVNGTFLNLIYAGTGNGRFTAFNAATGATVWSKTLKTSTYSCGGTTMFTFGVNGAPAIDRATNRVYVGDGALQVHALDLATGTEPAGWPVSIGTASSQDFIYAGVTYNPANHLLYAETSTTCDIPPWYGRIAAIDTTGPSIVNTFYPTQGTSGGGIWGFGGASIDAATNDVYIAVGNADTTNGAAQNAFYAENIVVLAPDLSTVIANNFPPNPPGSDDNDFGATPLLFQPPGCPPLLAAINKSGEFDLYNRTAIGSGPLQQVQMSITTNAGDFIGLPAYDPVTHYVYVGLPATFGIYRPGMAAFSISPSCTINTTPAWAAGFGADGATTGSDTPRSPITIANGVAYISDYATSKTYAFDAATGAQLWSATLGGNGIVGPIVVNGRLYIGSLGTTMTAWSP